MRIRLLESSVGQADGRQFLISYLINDTIAIDAGSIGYLLPMEAQRRIQHVLLSHSHIDHIGSLPIFLDNVFEPVADCPAVYASASVLECLDHSIFNDVVWPNLEKISTPDAPFFRRQLIKPEEPFQVENLAVTPVTLRHIVPTMGFVLDDGDSSVGIVCDTLPSDDIWNTLNSRDNLQAVFLEASFPNSMQWLADKAHHLTPQTFREEAKKLTKPVPVIAVHLKAAYRSQIIDELEQLDLPNMQIAEPGNVYDF